MINNLVINYDKNEIYMYDEYKSILEIWDYKILEIKKRKKVPLDDGILMSFEKIEYNNETNTIVVDLENSSSYIYDMDTLEVIREI